MKTLLKGIGVLVVVAIMTLVGILVTVGAALFQFFVIGGVIVLVLFDAFKHRNK
jgi:hypothetical protein